MYESSNPSLSLSPNVQKKRYRLSSLRSAEAKVTGTPDRGAKIEPHKDFGRSR